MTRRRRPALLDETDRGLDFIALLAVLGIACLALLVFAALLHGCHGAGPALHRGLP